LDLSCFYNYRKISVFLQRFFLFIFIFPLCLAFLGGDRWAPKQRNDSGQKKITVICFLTHKTMQAEFHCLPGHTAQEGDPIAPGDWRTRSDNLRKMVLTSSTTIEWTVVNLI
jgi:hypothetical protein